MSSQLIRYYCQNCEKEFKLAENETPRCPFCFWTSAIRPLDEVDNSEAVLKKNASPEENISNKKKISPQSLALGIFLIVLGLLAAWLFIKKPFHHDPSKAESAVNVESDTSKKSETKTIQPEPQDIAAALSEEEKAVLLNQVPIPIPRKLSEDETQILNRRVDFSADEERIPQMKFWTIDDFKKFLKKQQQSRGIYFSWGYEHALTNLFMDHYLKAEALIQSSQYEAAQLELFNSLVFPVYANDIRLHRAVALVMLQDLIKDTLDKIKALNSYLLKQKLAQEVRELRENYDGFFEVVKKEDWEEALRFVERLEEKAKSIETQIKQSNVQYPPVVSKIDEDIQRGLSFQDEPASSFSTSLNSLLTDLRIKRNTLQQNMTKSLESVKDQYETALKAIQEKKWGEAQSALESISYPPEIAADAKHKAAILEKLTQKSK